MASDVEGGPGVEHVAYFGSALHVSGMDRALLETSLQAFKQDGMGWTEVRPSLEDSFIALMKSSGEDMRRHHD